MSFPLRLCLTFTLILALGACALLPQRDPVSISVVGIKPLPAQDLEIRMAVTLRLLNPNDTVIDYDGIALDLDVNGRTLASGVSDQHGSVGRYGETLLTVPVSISAFSALRQALGLSQGQGLQGLPYVVRGKLAGGVFGTVRFKDSGVLDLSPPTQRLPSSQQ
jgi:LEA14-like dessication related protein